MVRFPFLSKSKKTAAAWPCVAAPSTPSFRRAADESETLSDSSDSSSSDSAVARGLRSDRLIFQPGETNSIIKSTKSPADENAAASLVAVDSADPYLDFRASMEEMVEAHGFKDWDSLEKLLAVYLRVNRRCNHGYIVGAFVDLLLHLGTPEKMNTTTNNSSSTGKDECSSSTATATASLTSPLSFSSSTRSSVSPCSRSYKM